jgi:integrase
VVDGAGFEPAASTKLLEKVSSKPTFSYQYRLSDTEIIDILDKFSVWLEVDELRKPRTIRHHTGWIKRLLNDVRSYPPEKVEYRRFLMKWRRACGVYHYSNAVKAIRVFTRFLGCDQIGKSFKLPRINRPIIIVKKKTELQQFYNQGLSRLDDQAFFLVLASSGLRNHEATGLTPIDLNLESGMIIPNSSQATTRGTKNTFVTFINSEAKTVLKEYLSTQTIGERDRIFRKGFGRSGITYRWNKASEKSGIKLVPSDLRDWFCCEMGKLGVSDRYIDAFCGRVPRSILARHYTAYNPEELKLIYDKAGLRVGC